MDSRDAESSRFPKQTTIDDLPTARSVFSASLRLCVSASLWLASAVFWIDRPNFGARLISKPGLLISRKGAKHAKGDRQASNSNLLMDSRDAVSSRLPERTTVDDLPTA